MASSISEAQAELISSLSPDDIPIKLRCAICSKLAVNAFRLPCCEQAICETCQSSLPLSCPVCEHSPLAAEDCNPNKSLRTTIRVFLRTAEKKREANRAKESKDSVSAAPVDAPKPSIPDAEPAVERPPVIQPVIGATVAHQESDTPSRFKNLGAVHDVTQAADKPDPSPDNGPWTKQTDQASAVDPAPAVNQDADGNNNNIKDVVIQTVQGAEEMANGQVGFGMDGGFPNTNMMFPAGGDFNQMQMMMAMQNGMGTASFGGFPMMGMGMDPMTMQNMYMNGGFQGMGMGGYGGGYGQGSNNNWNGAQSWSFDYNHGGDYGNMTAGFQTGYNQGNYGGHFNDYRRNNFGRGRGRGRGYYGGFGGRGGHYQDNQDQGGFYPQPDARRPGDEGGQGMMELKSAAGAAGSAGSAGAAGAAGAGAAGAAGAGAGATAATAATGGGRVAEAARGDSGGQLASSRENLGNEAASGDVLSRDSTAGAIRSVLSTPDVPINAPTGPKAMRQGLPNTSLHNLRARGYQVDGAVEEPRARSRSPEREAERRRQDQQDDGGHCEKQQEENGEPSSTDKMAEADRPSSPVSPPPPPKAKRSHSRSPSHSRSRSRHRSPSRSRGGRHRRPPSPPTEGDGQGNSRRRKRPRGGRKHGGEHYTPSKEERHSRSASVERTSHRGHNKDKERRERRSHRERSRDRGRDRDYDYDHSSRRERERRERRDEDEDGHRRRHHHHHHHHHRNNNHDHHNHHHRRDPTSPPPSGKTMPDLVRRSSATAVTSTTNNSNNNNNNNTHSTVVTDAHTIEREARNRERLLKEAQRIAGLAAGSKRGRDISDDGARKGRRPAVRRSDNDEERMRRLEAEREGGRWD